MRRNDLSRRELSFVLAYIASPVENGKQAAISAGYSARTATVTASKLLTRGNVLEAIESHRRMIAERMVVNHGVTLDWVIAELAKIGRANSADYIDIQSDGTPRLNFAKVTRDQFAAVASVECEIVGHEEVFEKTPDGEVLESSLPIRKVKYRLHDKRAALVDLARLLGAKLPDPSAQGGPTTININNDNRTLVMNGLSEDELARQYREKITASPALPRGPRTPGT
jgi:phage terminase small subunit